MKTVCFVRHAKSSWDNPTLPDFNRPLNARGLRDAPAMAKFIHSIGIHPDRLVSSPAKRALSTAQFFAETFGIQEVHQEARLYEALPETVLEIVQNFPETCSVCFVFGHNPTFHELANYFSGTSVEALPTCSFFRIDAAVESWRSFSRDSGKRTAFFTPKQLHI